jgi:mono/diheme cytochrome c family protein
MKKIILSLFIIASSLFALSGESVYTQHCAVCHKMMKPKTGLLAPPMPAVSKRLQRDIHSKEKFVAFVKDYIKNPSRDKGHCSPKAFINLGTMPPIGKSLTKEELDTVSLWLYENFSHPEQIKSCDTDE